MSWIDDFNIPGAPPPYNERTCDLCGHSDISIRGRCYTCQPICARDPKADQEAEREYLAEQRRCAPGWHVHGWKPAKWETEELHSLGAFETEAEALEAAKAAGVGDSRSGVPMKVLHRLAPKPYWGAQ